MEITSLVLSVSGHLRRYRLFTVIKGLPPPLQFSGLALLSHFADEQTEAREGSFLLVSQAASGL